MKKFSLVFLGLLVLVGLVGGCAGPRSTVTEYFYPNWTPDGKIICTKRVTVSEQTGMTLFGGGTGSRTVSINYYITTMSDEGTQETDIKEIAGIGKVSASPLGNYVAYTEGNYIRIISSGGSTVKSIDCSESINSFDWSPDETRLAFATETNRRLFVLNISSEAITQIGTNAADVAWRKGEIIAYGYLNLINSDGSNNRLLTDGGKPQIMNSGKILYYADFISLGEYMIKSMYPTGTGETVVISDYDKSSLKISFDNLKIVGGELEGNDIQGIWFANLDGSQSKKIR